MHIFIVGPAAHWLSGNSAAVATAGTYKKRGKKARTGPRGKVEDAQLIGGWVVRKEKKNKD